MWLQEFVPPPTCFLAKWIVSMCWDNKYTSHCLIWAKHLDPMAYKHGQNTIAKKILKGTCENLVHECKNFFSKLINKGTFCFL
jgi:hypothetical protein